MSESLDIAGRPIGAGHPCFVIAEIAQAHDGSLGAAHAYIDAVARTGADAIKFQTHYAAEESTRAEPWRVKFSKQDESRYDYWRRMEFSDPQWEELAAHSRECGLVFLSSAFSPRAVELLARLDMPAWKIASGEIDNTQLLDAAIATGRPVLLSSGLADWATLDAAAERVRRGGAPLALFQTTTSYPCPPERLGLNVLSQLRERYRCPVGLSDHSATIYAGLAATALGANLLEVHVVFSRDCFGPDTGASVTIDELTELVHGIRFVEKALSVPVDKDAEARSVADLRVTFGKSWVAARPLDAGAVLTASDVALKKPGGGFAAAELDRILGRKLRHRVPADHQVAEEDLEQ